MPKSTLTLLVIGRERLFRTRDPDHDFPPWKTFPQIRMRGVSMKLDEDFDDALDEAKQKFTKVN